MRRRVTALMLAMLAGAASSQPPPLAIAFVTIEAHGYSIGKTRYESVSDLVRGLKAMPRLDGIGLTTGPGASEDRLSITIKAIQAAGISARIAVVGNEVFDK